MADTTTKAAQDPPEASPEPPQPTHQQFAPQQYYNPQYYQATEEEPLWNASQTTALLTIGGMLGVGAAAAVRWLNGGDFCLFPPAHRPDIRLRDPTERTAPTTSEGNLSEILEAHYDRQEQLLAQFTRQSTSLSDIRCELVRLHRDMLALKVFGDNERTQELHSKLIQTIGKLEAALKADYPDLDIPDDPVIQEEEEPIEEDPLPSLNETLRKLAVENTSEDLLAGTPILFLYVTNLAAHPTVPRYRKIYTSNESFQKVQRLEGATDLLRLLGFREANNCWEWSLDDPKLAPLESVTAALNVLKTPQDVEPDALAQLAIDATQKVPMTPDTVLLSPPATKKIIDGFPPVHPLSEDDVDLSELPPRRLDDDGHTTMWK